MFLVTLKSYIARDFHGIFMYFQKKKKNNNNNNNNDNNNNNNNFVFIIY